MKLGFPSRSVVKNRLPVQETWVWSLGWEDPLERERATHSSFLAWEIPWTEKPGGLQFMELQKSWANWAATQQQQCDEVSLKTSEGQGLDTFQVGEHIQVLRGRCSVPPPVTCPASLLFGCILHNQLVIINTLFSGVLWVVLVDCWRRGESLVTSPFTARWQPGQCSWHPAWVQSCWTEPVDSDDDPGPCVRRELNCRLSTWCLERLRVAGCEKEPHTFVVRSVVRRISPPAYSR